MDRTSRANRVIRLGGSFSILAAMSACLALWGGIDLMHPHTSLPAAADEPAPPRPLAEWQRSPQARRALANLLLFWVPLGLGAVASSVGIVTLACSRERDLESHRALIALLLSAIPGCLCTLWYAAFSAPSF